MKVSIHPEKNSIKAVSSANSLYIHFEEMAEDFVASDKGHKMIREWIRANASMLSVQALKTMASERNPFSAPFISMIMENIVMDAEDNGDPEDINNLAEVLAKHFDVSERDAKKLAKAWY